MHRGDRDRDFDHHDNYYARDRLHDSRPRMADYGHLDERGRPEIIDRRREVCKNFLLGRCKKGTACPYAHSSYIPESEKKEMCRDFQRGSCPRGERSCPFIHAPAGAGVLPGRDLASPPRRMGGPPYSPPHSSPLSSRGGAYPLPPADPATVKNGRAGPEVCRDFLYRKNCSRGKACPYLHVALDDKDSVFSNKKRRSELTKEQEDLQRENRLLRDENDQIDKENGALRRENEDFREENLRLRQYLEEITGRATETASCFVSDSARLVTS